MLSRTVSVHCSPFTLSVKWFDRRNILILSLFVIRTSSCSSVVHRSTMIGLLVSILALVVRFDGSYRPDQNNYGYRYGIVNSGMKASCAVCVYRNTAKEHGVLHYRYEYMVSSLGILLNVDAFGGRVCRTYIRSTSSQRFAKPKGDSSRGTVVPYSHPRRLFVCYITNGRIITTWQTVSLLQ
jgi:hypothetical protein